MDTATATDQVKPFHIRLVKLAKEGHLRCGDVIEHFRLGVCEVIRIHEVHTLDVMDAHGKCFRLTGLAFGGARLVERE